MSLADALKDTLLVPKTHAEDVEMAPSEEAGGEDSDDAPAQDEDMQDLFGEDNTNVVDGRDDDPTTPGSSEPPDGISSPERKHRDAMEYPEEDEQEPLVEQVLEANAAIPNIPTPKSSDGNHWVIRMPNFVKLDSKPFHPDTYVGPEHDDEDAPTESLREKSMSIKLKVENTVRWRWVKDAHGQDKRQSNSRIIRWSDGTLSLKLGKELFDITQTVDTSGAVPRQSFGGPSQSQSQGTLNASQSQTPSNGKIPAQGLTYLVAQHKRAEILQCEAVVTGYMSLRPTGMQSETHRMLVRAVGQKHSKVARLRMAPDPTMDPEREKMEMLKQAAKKPRKSRGDDNGLGGMGALGGRKRRSGYSRKRSGEDMWSDDDDDAEGYGRGGNGGSEDEYGMEGGDRGGKRNKEENTRKGPGEYQTDDFVVSDSDDEDGGHGDEGGSRKKRRRRQEDEEDDLEKLEAKIDQQEAEERKRKQREAGGSSGGTNKGGDEDTEDGGDAMDVESEEEEEYGVRKAGVAPGHRKKRAIEFDEEDED
ncbi:Leo1-like protein-domain-containing protein [Cristinia sonorae]|uniref:Leo1-like protein-domain-containing protein n=1 Tax=Cristinia sonorae TaxID=1940300 RepID=A0A8K0XMZ9_9AGAR|nr:Leo1-like protein-domain-containing protein [Cristinia sonorae]